MELENSKVVQLRYEHHNPVMVGLEVSFVDHADSENFLRWTKNVDVFVEDFEVEKLVKVGQHELEAQLVIQFLPVEGSWVIHIESLILDCCLRIALLVLVADVLVQTALIGT